MTNREPEIPAWKKHDLENRHKSLEQRRAEQVEQLNSAINKLKRLFESIFLPAVRIADGEHVDITDKERIAHMSGGPELVKRLESLRCRFENEYYDAIDTALGEGVIKRKEVRQEEDTERAKALEQVMEEAGQSGRLPKGFGKWSLKMVKLNESDPASGNNKWIEFWSLQGETAIGRVLYNAEKDLHYFRPYDVNAGFTFPLTHDQGRKLTREGRNYYFRKADPPPDEA